MHRKVRRVAFLALPFLFMKVPMAVAANAANGADLAHQWCAACHAIEGAPRASDTAPSFLAVAQKYGSDPAWVDAWLTNPHPPMQGIGLSRREIDDIEAYLKSLAPRSQ